VCKLNVVSEYSFKDGITSLELADLTKDGMTELILATMDGDVRIFRIGTELEEIAKVSCEAPVATLGLGDLVGNNIPELVVGSMNNKLLVIAFEDGNLNVKDSTPLGTLPTAVMVTNVLGDTSSEVIIATNDSALRCYGWFEGFLDKLAHKVLERPTFSMRPIRTKGVPYNRFIFGDDSEHLYIYQYQDDRLHERAKTKINGEVQLVASGKITKGYTDQVVSITDAKKISLWNVEQTGFELLASAKASDAVTSLCVGKFYKSDTSKGQIIASQGDSSIRILDYDGENIEQVCTVKTARKSVESKVTFGDINGDGAIEVVQAVSNTIHIIDILNE
jgi:hypothetical protein